MQKKQVNIRLESELINHYERLANEHDRDRTYFMVKALKAFIGENPKPAKRKEAALVESNDVGPLLSVSGLSADAGVVIDYLNQIAGTKYRNSDSSRKDIVARLKQGFSVKDCKVVIDKKCAEWLGTDMSKYLRPQTLFNASKFDGYLNQLVIQSQTQINAREVDDWVSGSTKSVFGEVFDHE